MRAMVYTAPLELQMQDVAEPEPRPGEVVVEVRAAGICGSELEGFASRSPFRVPPLVMGHEFAGVRAEDGQPVVVNPLVSCGGCDLCLRGQPNLCRNRALIGVHRPGGFAERVAVPAESCHVLPDGLSFEQAAVAEPVANAVHAFRLAQLYDPLPQRVGVIGAGALGMAVLLVARDRGVPEIAVSDLFEPRLMLAEQAGADRTGSNLAGEYDIVFDAVGSAATRRIALECLRPGGTSVWIGLHSSDAGFDAQDLIRAEKRVLGTFAYHHQDFQAAIGLARAFQPQWLATRSLEEGVDTFTALLRAPAPTVKTLLIPGAS